MIEKQLIALGGINPDGSDYVYRIARYFQIEKEGKKPWIIPDTWPLDYQLWKGQAFLLPPDRWKMGDELPVMEPNSSMDCIGSLGIIADREKDKATWRPKADGKQERKTIGSIFDCVTQYGETPLFKFHSIPANPDFYYRIDKEGKHTPGSITVFYSVNRKA